MINRNQRKRKFLEWLTNNYYHRDPSVRNFLNYLMVQPDLINYVEFTDNAEETPRGIYITFQQDSDQPFIYYKDDHEFKMSEQAFHDLRLNSKFGQDIFYIEIDSSDIYKKMNEYDVFQENPYHETDNELDAVIEEGLDSITTDLYKNKIKAEVDEALEAKDYEKASYYVDILENIDGFED